MVMTSAGVILGLVLRFTTAGMPATGDLPIVTVTADNTVITASAIVRIPAGLVIPDADGNGVIRVTAPDVVLTFEEGSELRGAPTATPADTHAGVGIRVDAVRNVAVRNARVHGFKVGLSAEHADALRIIGGDFSDNYRQRLGSTPQAEDAADWLWPHANDAGEWTQRYGAAIDVRNAEGVEIRGIRIRRGQNGIVLDRVTRSIIAGNDCSFLSGWGLAMWRSSENLVYRNAFDFCVRGYSHGVYNRGQDSAGILMFEQCSRNAIVENSATHGGDGFFGFAGKEALGEAPPSDPTFDYTRRGCNDNLLRGNDFSYAPAHGIEMTFSFGNRFIANRLVGNAICGVWGGYSQDTVIVGNTIESNGRAGYGAERGGINIEHAGNTLIADNRFAENAKGIHLWTDADEALRKTPWAKANYPAAPLATITGNIFERDDVAIVLRDAAAVRLSGNAFKNVGKEIERAGGAEPTVAPPMKVPSAFWPADAPRPTPELEAIPSPVGARAKLAGREHIIMGTWGPWDHQAPMVRPASRGSEGDVFEVFGATEAPTVSLEDLSGRAVLKAVVGEPDQGAPGTPRRVRIVAPPGVWRYNATIRASGPNGEALTVVRTIVAAEWDVVVFPWTTDPRQDNKAWRQEASGTEAARATIPSLSMPFGAGSARSLRHIPQFRDSNLPRDRFGVIARTSLPLTAGRWRVRTLSDDGVRVRVGGRIVIENWTWHAPTTDTGEFDLPSDGTADIEVEYFELDGHAVLEMEIEPAESASPAPDAANP